MKKVHPWRNKYKPPGRAHKRLSDRDKTVRPKYIERNVAPPQQEGK